MFTGLEMGKVWDFWGERLVVNGGLAIMKPFHVV